MKKGFLMVESKSDTHILIVDDEESIRITFEIFLQREGYGKISTASSVSEARTQLEQHQFDLIISDIVLGDGSGTELLHYIQEHGIECPVVMITGFPNIDSAAEAVRFGAFDYIPKPVNKQTLLKFVQHALNHWALVREKKELEQQNEKYRRYLEVIFSSVTDGIISVDEKMNIIQLNQAARKFLGLDLTTRIQSNLREIRGGVATACLADAQQVVQHGKDISEHRLEVVSDGVNSTIVSLTGSPLHDDLEDLSGVVLVIRDVTPPIEKEVKEQNRTEFHGFIGYSPVMQGIYNLIENVGKVDTAVLITGESGTGKEIAAETLHAESPRRNNPLIKVDCGSVSEDLLESELFGHKKGSFTGADRDRPGRLLLADQGTLFLDEIGDISPRMQLRLLRFLQEKTFTPVGQDQPVQVDVRVIAATNVNLQEKVRSGQFREDLYYRLKVVEIVMPPLRERLQCIPYLIQHFLNYFSNKLGRKVQFVSDQASETLSRYSWPGNVRELRHVIERGCVMCTGQTLQLEHLPKELLRDITSTVGEEPSGSSTVFSGQTASMAEPATEKEILVAMLARVGGNKAKAARLLGIDRSTLYRKMKKYQLSL